LTSDRVVSFISFLWPPIGLLIRIIVRRSLEFFSTSGARTV